MKKTLATSLALAALVAVQQHTYANTDENTLQTVNQKNAAQNQTQKTWLGVSLAPVPMVLSKQLATVIPENQGVMVQSVSPDSPASKAGLQAYDILLSFNDQKLYSAQQLAGLVASAKADTEVSLGLVRNGKKENLKVTLAGRAIPNVLNYPRRAHPFLGFNSQPFAKPWFPQGMPSLQGKTPSQPGAKTNVMQQFESISINKTGDGKVRAEVSYDNNGDKKQFSFEGKYDEVRKQIKETKELPEDKKNSLLNALKNNPNQLMPDDLFRSFQPMPAFPSFNGFFNDPFFNRQNQQPMWLNNGRKL